MYEPGGPDEADSRRFLSQGFWDLGSILPGSFTGSLGVIGHFWSSGLGLMHRQKIRLVEFPKREQHELEAGIMQWFIGCSRNYSNTSNLYN